MLLFVEICAELHQAFANTCFDIGADTCGSNSSRSLAISKIKFGYKYDSCADAYKPYKSS